MDKGRSGYSGNKPESKEQVNKRVLLVAIAENLTNILWKILITLDCVCFPGKRLRKSQDFSGYLAEMFGKYWITSFYSPHQWLFSHLGEEDSVADGNPM